MSKTASPREIERKFLVKRLPDGLTSFPHDEIMQGYLAIEEGGVQVRLRQKGSIRSLTYKRGNRRAREEREIRLSAEQFDALWPATAGRRLTKIRYEVPWREHTIEIDIYRGRHDGLGTHATGVLAGPRSGLGRGAPVRAGAGLAVPPRAAAEIGRAHV